MKEPQKGMMAVEFTELLLAVVIGGVLVLYPLATAAFADQITRWVIWHRMPASELWHERKLRCTAPWRPRPRATLVAALPVSMIGCAVSAALLYATLALIPATATGKLWHGVLIVVSVLYWAALVALSLLTSMFNYYGTKGKSFFPGIWSRADIASAINPSQFSLRSRQLGAYSFLRLAAVLTAIALAVGYYVVYLMADEAPASFLYDVSFAAVGATLFGWAVLRFSLRRFLEARALNLVSQELQQLEEDDTLGTDGDANAALDREFDRRDELPTLLRRSALRNAFKRRYYALSAPRAQTYAILGAARYFERVSARAENLRDELTGRTNRVLLLVALVLCGGATKSSLRELALATRAFDADGTPHPELVKRAGARLPDRIEGLQPLLDSLKAVVSVLPWLIVILLPLFGAASVEVSPF